MGPGALARRSQLGDVAAAWWKLGFTLSGAEMLVHELERRGRWLGMESFQRPIQAEGLEPSIPEPPLITPVRF